MADKKLHAFFSLSFKDKLFFMAVVVLLATMKLILVTIPFKRMAAHLGTLNGSEDQNISVEQRLAAQRIKLFIYMAGGNVPWRSVCLDQALACMFLLSRNKIPCTLLLGVKKDASEAKIKAHAWVLCGDEILVGGRRSQSYMVVARFSKVFNGKGDLRSIPQ